MMYYPFVKRETIEGWTRIPASSLIVLDRQCDHALIGTL